MILYHQFNHQHNGLNMVLTYSSILTLFPKAESDNTHCTYYLILASVRVCVCVFHSVMMQSIHESNY